MAEIIRMPKLSDTMTDGVVAAWHKKVGDKVSAGEVLAEIETDKATMEFESFQDGVLLHIGVEKGKSAPVNNILAIIGTTGEDISALLKEESVAVPASESQPQTAVQEVKMETSVAAVVPQKAAVATPPVQTTSMPAEISANGRIFASPLARKLAEEKGINISRVRGSGEGGRIVKRDIENYQGGAMAFTSIERFTEEPVSQMRRVIAQRLSESKFSAPHFYLTISINMDNAMEARTSINKYIEPQKVSFNDMVIKAAAVSLRKHPKVNAAWLGDRIRYNEHIHIGMAVAVEEGLLVPVIRFADNKTLTQIGAEAKSFADRARARKLQPEDWAGNTFTISNLGMFGIEEFTAIINPPDACILAVGGISQVPVVKNGTVVPGNVMKVTLSCDHRVVDGAVGSAFLQTFKNLLENPVLLLGEASI
jgi:pyruvate dehydrogenase E2 component (dihydrolipoamide acetyltransferase)